MTLTRVRDTKFRYGDSPDEAIREKTLNLITHVEIEPAHLSDVHALVPALESTRDRGLIPEEVISPVMGTPKADFQQTDKGKIAACPQGHAPVKFKMGKNNAMSVAFDSAHCSVCPLQNRCPAKPGRKRHYLRFGLKALRIAGRRAMEHTPEFKDKYRWRSGIESTFSEMDKKTGVKRLRVRGLSAVGYCARLKAIGVNIFRAAKVKGALEDLRTATKTGLSGFGSTIFAVKELSMSLWSKLRNIFKPASVNTPYTFSTAA